MMGINGLSSFLYVGGDKPHTKSEGLRLLTLVKPFCIENTYFYIKHTLANNITVSEKQQ